MPTLMMSLFFFYRYDARSVDVDVLMSYAYLMLRRFC